MEPFPLDFEEHNRTCNLVEAVISGSSGAEVSFVKPVELSLGGIASTLSSADQQLTPNDTVIVNMTTVGV